MRSFVRSFTRSALSSGYLGKSGHLHSFIVIWLLKVLKNHCFSVLKFNSTILNFFQIIEFLDRFCDFLTVWSRQYFTYFSLSTSLDHESTDVWQWGCFLIYQTQCKFDFYPSVLFLSHFSLMLPKTIISPIKNVTDMYFV